MKPLDWLKLVAALLVVGAGWWRFEDWKADLRREGEIRLLTEARDSADAAAAELADSLARLDSIRVAEIAEAEAEAERAREDEARAARQAASVRRERAQLVDSILRATEHVEEVQAALEAQAASYEAELEEKDRQIAALRTAEGQAWATVRVYEARLIDRDTQLAAKDAQIALRDEIIARRERSGSGHGPLVDVLIAVGGVAMGVAGATLGG